MKIIVWACLNRPMDDGLSSVLTYGTKVGDMDADIRADMRRQLAKARAVQRVKPVPLQTCSTGTSLNDWHSNLGFIMCDQRFASRCGILWNSTNKHMFPSAQILFAEVLCCSAEPRRFSLI